MTPPADDLVRVQACRPEDRAMLQTDAGRELLTAAKAAIDDDLVRRIDAKISDNANSGWANQQFPKALVEEMRDRIEALQAELDAERAALLNVTRQLRETQEARASWGKEVEREIATWSAKLKAAEARAEAAEKDAERYRWLRDVGDKTWTPLVERGHVGMDADMLDAAIDAAIAAQAGK